MQISSFNGGLNKRVSPYLMQSNEGVEYSNIDTTSGALAPLKEHKDLNAKIKPSFTYFNNHWVDSDESRDYVKFQEKLFYSNGQTRPQWSKDGFTWYGLGIDKPEDSLSVYLGNNSKGLNLKALYGYFEGGDNPSVAIEVSFQAEISDVNVLKNFETGSVSGYYNIGKHQQVEFIKNMKSKIFEDGELSKNNFVLGEATIYNQIKNTSDSFVAVICRERIVSESGWKDLGSLVELKSPFCYDSNWYVKTSSDEAFQVKTVRKATRNISNARAINSGYISNVPGDYNKYPNIKTPLYIKPNSSVVFIVKNKDGVIYNILSDTVPDKYEILHKPTAGGLTYFAGFSFSWVFEQTDTVDIFVDGAKITTKKYSDIVRDSRVFVESKCIDRHTTEELQPILNRLQSIQYVITYSNGILESIPSDPISVPFLSGDSKTVLPYITIKASNDPQVTSIKLYRLGGGVTQFSLVKEFLNVDIEFTDSITNIDLDGAVLNSYNNLPAPDGLQYLTLYNTMLFGSIEDKLYYTDVATPFVWSGFNFIDFDDIITGLGGTPNGLLVFTKHSTYIVTGTSPDTFSKYLLSAGVGCVLHKSIQSLNNTLIWLSEDSICVSNGGEIQSISRDKLNALDIKTPRCSAVLNDTYYVSHQNGTLIADFRFGLIFRESDSVFYGLNVNDNILYGVDSNDRFVELYKGDKPSKIHYKSPKFSDGSISTVKTYKDIYFHSSGDLNVKVFIDDILVGDKDLENGFSELKVTSTNTRGYSIQFEVSGTGTLNEIEYQVEGRQNGR